MLKPRTQNFIGVLLSDFYQCRCEDSFRIQSFPSARAESLSPSSQNKQYRVEGEVEGGRGGDCSGAASQEINNDKTSAVPCSTGHITDNSTNSNSVELYFLFIHPGKLFSFAEMFGAHLPPLTTFQLSSNTALALRCVVMTRNSMVERPGPISRPS